MSFSPLLLQSGGGGIQEMLPLLLAFLAIFYFVLFRPQQREKKAREEMIKNLKKGDEVVIQGGIVAKIHRLETDGPFAHLDLDGTARMRVVRDSILKKLGEPAPAKKAADTKTPAPADGAKEAAARS